VLRRGKSCGLVLLAAWGVVSTAATGSITTAPFPRNPPGEIAHTFGQRRDLMICMGTAVLVVSLSARLFDRSGFPLSPSPCRKGSDGMKAREVPRRLPLAVTTSRSPQTWLADLTNCAERVHSRIRR